MGNQPGEQLNTLSSVIGKAQNAHGSGLPRKAPEKGAQVTKQRLVLQGVSRCHKKKSQSAKDTNKARGQGFS